jgi:hypothetical protein
LTSSFGSLEKVPGWRQACVDHLGKPTLHAVLAIGVRALSSRTCETASVGWKACRSLALRTWKMAFSGKNHSRNRPAAARVSERALKWRTNPLFTPRLAHECRGHGQERQEVAACGQRCWTQLAGWRCASGSKEEWRCKRPNQVAVRQCARACQDVEADVHAREQTELASPSRRVASRRVASETFVATHRRRGRTAPRAPDPRSMFYCWVGGSVAIAAGTVT